MIEPLEQRRLLANGPAGTGSIFLRGHRLDVHGHATEMNVVSIRLDTDAPNVVVAADFGGQVLTQSFAAKLVRRVRYVGGAKADLVVAGSTPPPLVDDPATPADESAAEDPLNVPPAAARFAEPHTFVSDERFTMRVTLDGMAGEDVLIGGHGKDTLRGGIDGDKLIGQGGVDRIHGDVGNDLLEGGTRGDFLYGGPGADQLNLLLGSQRQDRVSGGPDNDQIDFAPGLRLRQRRAEDVVSDVVV